MLACSRPSVGADRLFTENLWPVDFLRVAGFNSQQAWAPLDLDSVASTLARGGDLLGLLAALIATAVLFSRARGTSGALRALWPLAAALAVARARSTRAWKRERRLAPTPQPPSSTRRPTC